MPKFRIEYLPELDPPDKWKRNWKTYRQAKDKSIVFGRYLNVNDATLREYISILIITVKHKDPTTTLYVETELNGSKDYGNLDYEVEVQEVPVLINRAKKQVMEKGVAKNLVQLYTAAEVRPEVIDIRLFS